MGSRFLFLIYVLSLGVLAGCLRQPPAPVTLYGKSSGEGSAGVHNVSAGDTLWSVAQRYNLVMRDIIYYNHLSAPFKLAVGQRLRLPPPLEYEVKSGDNLYAISRLFDVSLHEVARMNHLSPPYTITPGRVLQLPSESGKVQEETKVAVAARPAAKPSVVSPLSNQKPEPAAKPTRQARAKITAKTPARSSSKFLQPTSGKVISSYGSKAGGLHNDGINIAAARGAPVAAAENGVVVYVGDELKGSGNLILVRHADQWMSAYAHLDKIDVARGAVVKRGQTIGAVGSTGAVNSPQLHFEIRRGTRAINPARYL